MGLPKAFRKIYEYTKSLVIKQTIDYDLIEDLLKEAAEESNFKLQVSLLNF